MGVRIIAGSLRSRVLQAPPGMATRPTSDRLRETLFNVLAPRIAGASFLDLYAGSGAVGIEALSRGAAHVEFVERAPAALAVLRGNLDKLGLRDGFRIHAAGVSAVLRKAIAANTRQFDIVFIDPPWDAADEYAATLGFLGGGRSGVQGQTRAGEEVSVPEFNRAESAGHARRTTPAPEKRAVLKRDGFSRAASAEQSTWALAPEGRISDPGSGGLLAPGAMVIAEHRCKEKLAENYGSLHRTRLLEQGDAALSFYVDTSAVSLPASEG